MENELNKNSAPEDILPEAEEKARETTGEAFVKWLRPAGCLLFLGLGILVTIFMFTAKGAPVEGYDRPESVEYYDENPEDIAPELEKMFSLIEGGARCKYSEGVITVTVPDKSYAKVRNGVLHYFGDCKVEFEFIKEE